MAHNEKRQDRRQQSRHTILLMKRILIHLRGQMDELLRPQGVTTAQLQMLRAIQASPGSSGAQLARECYVTPQSAQALIKQLESRGLIVRGKDAVNDRIVTARATPAGECLMASAEASAEDLLQKVWKGISESDIERLNSLLEQCLKNIGGDTSRAQ
ncbi:MarR family winged helix-turn-helix transcriptional regulator [Edaphobacter bradus]|uniref:MarR family winged helix-turn-helix transcriptional regulator n=1 Tax=Edaphobacter bradus TaxID=2259016 RepID=UPI0021E0049C|nr:MarR family winged helix-turn-helix transcriptional regulator [Edaphobacter bradus]